MTNLKSNGQASRASTADRWGITFSAGNGPRPGDLVYPGQSMLEQTLYRAEKLLPAQKLLVVVGREHHRFDEVRRQMASRRQGCIIIQPEHKDTGPGILLPLIHIHKHDPAAVVAVFPWDHFILEEDLFIPHLERAFRIVESDGSRIVLLGAEPNEPGAQCGYILPAESSDNPDFECCKTVEMFVEKPSVAAATMMMSKGGLWNTLVLVVRCETLLRAIERAAPEMYRCFEPIQDAIGTPEEKGAIEKVYQELPALNFSEGILEILSYENRQNLRVLSVRGVACKHSETADHLSTTVQR